MPNKKQVETAKALIAEGHSRRAAAAAVGIPESSLRYHLNNGSTASGRDRAEETPGVRVKGEEATIVSDSSKLIIDPKRLMEQTGFPQEDWEIAGDPVVNCWGDPGDLSYQVKVKLRERAPKNFAYPATHVPPVDRSNVKQSDREPRLVAIVADQQAPYHSRTAHALFLKWLEINRPDEVVLAGDTIDLPDISRHKDNPEWHVSTQECINSGYRLIRDYVEAAPQAEFYKLMGNHDERIRNELLLRAERLYGITPAPTDEDPNPVDAMSVRRLLHLDELGVELIEPNGNYTHAKHWIAPKLAVQHGWLTGQNTAAKSLKSIDYSLIVFHTHQQELTRRTIHRADGSLEHQYGVVGAAMCEIRGGIGFANNPNWQNGFVTAWVWPDGKFQIDHAQIEGNELLWNGERYTG